MYIFSWDVCVSIDRPFLLTFVLTQWFSCDNLDLIEVVLARKYLKYAIMITNTPSLIRPFYVPHLREGGH